MNNKQTKQLNIQQEFAQSTSNVKFDPVNKYYYQQISRQMTSDSKPIYFAPANRLMSLKEYSIVDKFEEKFSAIEQQFQTSAMLSQIQDQILQNKISKQQLEFDHGRHLPILNQQTQKYFLPHQRKGPYKNNLRKNLYQLKQLFFNQYKSICISYNKYSIDHVKAFFNSVRDYYDEQNQIKILTSLYAAWVRLDRIIQYLSFKRFTKLKILNIGGNFIQTIQPLCRVYLPEVQDIFLWNNHIMSIKTLRRVNWPNLRVLDLHANMITQIKQLRHLANMKIQCVNLDSNMFSNFDQVIVMSSKNGKLKISLINNKCIKFLDHPGTRRGRRANQVTPGSLRVKYS